MSVRTLNSKIEYFGDRLRGIFYSWFTKKTGKGFTVAQGSILRGLSNMQIGDNIFIGYNSLINGSGGLIIEDNVLFAPEVKILTANHNYKDTAKDIIFQGSTPQPVKIGKGSWLGAGSIILPGVTIGPHCVIGAGAVVTRSIPGFSIVGGVPARIIKKIK